ncbi:SAVED domain-containing protein [Sphingomonas sp. Leaf4]|uniref:SAVED domain-containing protein n=1 Tax=Sphingomonas sp. Leaf4 TaxID=2876553 RepID=UPI001E5B06C1|nr:SAVED domain-containing protein [Sphingomonas sp. Leaf4]
MAKTKPPQKIAAALWALAGGRCEYRGCNENLVGDLISGKRDALFGYIAHIVGDSEDGPRGDKVLSPKLAKELSNLMLLCGRHHKLIDVDDEEGHPVKLLHAMKDAHETRIATNTGISEEYASHVLRFGASIGNHEALVSTQAIFAAMPPDRHPATSQTIDLEMLNQAMKDDELEFWELQRKNLDRLFADRIGGRIERQEIRHLSVFALAPQPLLIELGRLLNEIVPITVHNRHREPTATWNWQRDRPVLDFLVSRPEADATGRIALKIAVSATVNDDRITRVLGDDAAIWTITIAKPGNDVVRQPEDLSAFRTTLREVYNEIKAQHGEGQVIHLFPVMPASLAVETGRIWMPKADLEMLIYDQNREKGFVPTLSIGAPVAK